MGLVNAKHDDCDRHNNHGYYVLGITVEYELVASTDNYSVCLSCNFLDSTTNYCVAVVHRNISHFNFSYEGLFNIESSHKFTRSGDTATGCIEGVNLEDYQIGVIGGKQARRGANVSVSI